MCETCAHPTVEHSREVGLGCLYIDDEGICPCLEPGSSEADQ